MLLLELITRGSGDVTDIHLILHKRPLKLVYNILCSILEVFNLFYELKDT